MARSDSAGIRVRRFDNIRHALGLVAWVVTGCLLQSSPAVAAGTPVGTIIDNQAEVAFDISGERLTLSSNLVRIVVDERIDVALTPLTNQVVVAPGEVNQVLVFSLSNTGNGSEAFALNVDNTPSGDDFDPIEAQPGIYFDSDGSGDLSVADIAYVPGTNDPVLAPDASVVILVVNDIPTPLAEGAIGRSALEAEALTGVGAPGTVVDDSPVGGASSVVGTSGGSAVATAEYIASSVQLTVVKSVVVADPFGGDSPVPGATLRYQIDVTVADGATAQNSVLTDPLPQYTTYAAGSLLVNGQPITDAADADAGEFDQTLPGIVVRLGDLAVANGTQTIIFEVTID